MPTRPPLSTAVKLASPLVLVAALGGPLGASAVADSSTASATGTTPVPAVTTAPAPASTTTTPTATTPGTGTATTPVPTPTPTPAVAASGQLSLSNMFVLHRAAVTVPGRPVRVSGTVRPFVAGQSVRVRIFLGRRQLSSRRLRIKPGAHETGRFSFIVSAPRAGHITLVVTHQRNRQMLGFVTRRTLTALSPHAGPGSRGPFVELIQQRLIALHLYLVSSGVYDQHTALAVDAYHRLLRRGHAQTLDRGTLRLLLNGVGAFHVRFPRQGHHAEGNLGLQLLALIDGSKVRRIYPISSGKPSTPTILGNFRIYERVPSYLPDGMYYSSFFFRGYAIHGFDPAPDFPASHGCMRLPISDAISAFDWLALGDWVDSYY